MSEPSHWGPPGAVARPPAPHSPAPHPTAQYPTADYPTEQFPAAQYPTGPRRVRQRAAPNLAPAYQDDYGDDRRDAYSSRRPRRRGQLFAGVVLVLALIVSALLGVLTYQVLASVDLISPDPFEGLASWVVPLGAAAFGAILVFVLAVVALVIAQPKALAGFGLTASLLLPAGAVVLGLIYGGAVLRQNVENDISAEGPAIARELAVNAVTQELERRGVDAGPLRDLIVGIAGQSG